MSTLGNPLNNPHAFLAGDRREACNHLVTLYSRLKDQRTVDAFVDVYASPKRMLDIFRQANVPADDYLAINPINIPGDVFREADCTSFKCGLAQFDRPGKFFFCFVNSHYHLEQADWENLAVYLKNGSVAFFYGHDFIEPYTVIRDPASQATPKAVIAEVTVTVRNYTFFTPGRLWLEMRVEGNPEPYSHAVSDIDLHARLQVTGGTLVSNIRWNGQKDCFSSIKELKFTQVPLLDSPTTAFSSLYQWHKAQFYRSWFNASVLAVAGISLWAMAFAYQLLSEYWVEPDPCERRVNLGGPLIAWALLTWFLPRVMIFNRFYAGCSLIAFGYAYFRRIEVCLLNRLDFVANGAADLVQDELTTLSCDYLGRCPNQWHLFAKAVVYYGASFVALTVYLLWFVIVLRWFGRRPSPYPVRGRIAFDSSGRISVYDPEIRAHVHLSCSTRTAHSDLDFLRRETFKIVSRQLDGYPRQIVLNTSEDVFATILAPTVYRAVTDWVFDGLPALSDLSRSWAIRSLAPLTVTSSIPAPVVRASTCCLTSPMYDEVLNAPRAQLVEFVGQTHTVPCAEKQVVYSLGRVYIYGKEVVGISARQCPHNLAVALHYRNYAPVPVASNAVLRAISLISKAVFRKLPSRDSDVMSLVDYINTFPPSRRGALRAEYERQYKGRSLHSAVEQIVNRPPIKFDVMVKADEIYPKMPHELRPRTIAIAPLPLVLFAGPTMRALSKYFMASMTGDDEIEYRGVRFRVHYGPGCSAAEINRQLFKQGHGHHFVVYSDQTNFDRHCAFLIQSAMLAVMFEIVAHRNAICRNRLLRRLILALCEDVNFIFKGQREFDSYYNFSDIDGVITGSPATSIVGTLVNIMISMFVFSEVNPRPSLVDLYLFGDDNLSFLTFEDSAAHPVPTSLSSADYEDAYRTAGFTVKFGWVSAAESCLAATYLKMRLVRTSTAYRLVPSMGAVMIKLFVSHSAKPPVDRLAEKVTAIRLSCVATPLLSQTVTMLYAKLGHKEASGHPDVLKPTHCELTPYTELERTQFKTFYGITEEEYCSYLVKLPEMVDRLEFRHVVLDKVFSVEGLAEAVGAVSV